MVRARPYNRVMTNRRLSGLALLAALILSTAEASERLPLFQDDSILKAVLTAPIAQAYAQSDQDVRIYLPGAWAHSVKNGDVERFDVSIRTRGLFRRENCDLPPLQLNFKKKQVKGTLLAGQDKLKIVAPCGHGAEWQQKVILELQHATYTIKLCRQR